MPGLFQTRRAVVSEMMDSPRMEGADHHRALAGLRRLNRISGAARQVARPLLALARQHDLNRLSILDVACGGGDVPLKVAQMLGRAGIKAHLTLFDRSAGAVRHAVAHCSKAGVECRGIEGDAAAGLDGLRADAVTNTLFLHHLHAADEATALLAHLRSAAGRIVVVSDLRRSRFGTAAAWSACRVLSRSEVVHHDGPASARAAWSEEELADFARRAGMEGAKIERSWPWRMLLTWERRAGAS